MAQQRRRTTSRSTYSRSSNGARSSQKKSYKKPASGSARKRNRGSAGVLSGVIIILLLLAGAAVVGIMSVKDLYNDRIVEGIALEGVNLGGMTRDEAYVALSSKLTEDMKKISLLINYDGRQWHYDSDKLKASSDVSEIIDQIIAIGHTGGVKQRLDEAKLAKAGHYNHLVAQLGIDDSLIGYFVENIKNELDKPATEPSYNFDPTGYGFAEYDSGVDPAIMFNFTDGIPGIEVDAQATIDAIKADLQDDLRADVQVVVNEVQPTTDAELIKNSMTLLYHASTQLARLPGGKPNTNRNHNIGLALSKFDGMTIMPNEAISYNTVVGERTSAAGFVEAGTIARDKTLVDALGGGICQGATTLYRAAFFAGCEILDRSHHSWPAYLELEGQRDAYGMDAMVNWGTDDLVFVNRSEAPMYINFYFWENSEGEPRYVDIDIYGLPLKDGMTIGFDTSEHEIIDAPEPEYEADTTNKFPDENYTYNAETNQMEYVYRKSRAGHNVRVYRIWKKDGVEVERELMHYDQFQPIKGLIYTKPAPAVPSPTPDPSGDSGAVG